MDIQQAFSKFKSLFVGTVLSGSDFGVKESPATIKTHGLIVGFFAKLFGWAEKKTVGTKAYYISKSELSKLPKPIPPVIPTSQAVSSVKSLKTQPKAAEPKQEPTVAQVLRAQLENKDPDLYGPLVRESKPTPPSSMPDVSTQAAAMQAQVDAERRKEYADSLEVEVPVVVEAPKLEHTPTRSYSFQVDDSKAIYGKMKVMRGESGWRVIHNPGGAVNVGADLVREDPTCKVGVMIAANSGLPGGALGHRPGKIKREDLEMKTQEESIWANAVLSECGTDTAKQLAFHEQTIAGKWGMEDLNDPTNNLTRQGIDFTTASDASAYNQVHVVQDCKFSGMRMPSRKFTKTYQACVVFADSVNAGATGKTPTSTMTRTLNAKAQEDYGFFKECIKTKLRASLDAMAEAGVTHPLIAKISCGIYAGKHREAINRDFTSLLQEVLEERVGPEGQQRGRYFKDVVIPEL